MPVDKKEHLKSMLTNIVHDRNEEATVDFHNYLQAKMRDVVNPAIEVKDPDENVNSND